MKSLWRFNNLHKSLSKTTRLRDLSFKTGTIMTKVCKLIKLKGKINRKGGLKKGNISYHERTK